MRLGEDGRAAAGDVGGLLEGVGELQDAPVVVMPADDLEADGQAALRKGAGDGRGGVAGGGNVIGGLHPRDVVLHFCAGDFGGVVGVHVERKNLVDRQNKKFVVGHESSHALEE